ncbi:MAG: PEP-CTERM sorting domain-containing protein [Phycisphaerae bacterium]|nr:PEP-CTERM sorting domain-containing protein [Phycisphaerae bacterium]MDD5380666.1 PEP-CTERM sorting domain-containing protein [Phycisphaerae bacterium]
MKNHCLILILLTFLSVEFIPANAKASLTIATFADPSRNSNNPLFTVDFTQMKFTGGWDDEKTGLTLEIPYSDYTIENGTAFENVWFEMTDVNITDIDVIWGQKFGQTGSGVISFYEDDTNTDPLVVIEFDSGLVWQQSFGGDEIFVAENVTITGSKITGTLSEEQFTFGFANQAKLPGPTDWNDGFTATAAFTSSAVSTSAPAPEPATICLLGLGALSLLRSRKKKTQDKDNE